MRRYVSLFIVVLIASVELAALCGYYPKWKNQRTEAVISWDVSGYYLYLPAIFIYHDLKKCRFHQHILDEYGPTPDFQQAFLHASGNYVMKYSSGQAIMLSPAFFAAHWYCKITKTYPADGFSQPYQLAVALWSWLISLLGLLALRKVLIHYFTDAISALTIFSIALCSNYFEYATFTGPMTHNSLFTLYAVLILTTIRFYENMQLWRAALIGMLCGLATITRPTECISVIIPLCWGLTNVETLKHRFRFFVKNNELIIGAAISFIAVVSIQFIYWKYVSGEWLVYSYQEQTFDWFRPHIIDCLFSPKAGWLLYSPIMGFSLVGFYFLYKEKSALFVTCLTFAVPFTYLCFSWSEWWYGWSLGQRAMVQSYPIFAIPMAMCFTKIFSLRYSKPVMAVLLAILLYYNLWLVHQSHHGGLMKGPAMNKTYLWAILGKFQVDEQTMTLLDNTEYLPEPQQLELLYENRFDNDTSANRILTDSASGNAAVRVNQELQQTKPYFLNADFRKAEWYYVTAEFYSDEMEWDMWKTCLFEFQFFDGPQEVKRNQIHAYRLIDLHRKKAIHYYARAPRVPFNNVAVMLDNYGSSKEVRMDNLKVFMVKP